MRRPIIFAWVAAPLLAGVSLVLGAEVGPFSHKLHLEQGAACDTCHDADSRPVPALRADACRACHEEGAPAYRRADRPPFLASFPHAPHAAKLECRTCHAATADDLPREQRPRIDHETCARCHREKKVVLAEAVCASCHGKDMRREKPASHSALWRENHGEQAGWLAQEEHGRDCSACHRRADCVSCHRLSRPRNHDALWGQRTHGLEASWDRESCKTCHESGSCVRCHKTTPPQNHTAAWSANHGPASQGAGNAHCAVCHNTGFCRTCHGR